MQGICSSHYELVIGDGCVSSNSSRTPVSVPIAIGSVAGGLAVCGWCFLAFIAWTRRPRRRSEEEAFVVVQRTEFQVTQDMNRVIGSRKSHKKSVF